MLIVNGSIDYSILGIRLHNFCLWSIQLYSFVILKWTSLIIHEIKWLDIFIWLFRFPFFIDSIAVFCQFFLLSGLIFSFKSQWFFYRVVLIMLVMCVLSLFLCQFYYELTNFSDLFTELAFEFNYGLYCFSVFNFIDFCS